MAKFKNGDFVTDGKHDMIVRLDIGKDKNGQICCEYTNENGDEKFEFFEPFDLSFRPVKKGNS